MKRDFCFHHEIRRKEKNITFCSVHTCKLFCHELSVPLYYILVLRTKSHFSRFYSFYTVIINISGIKTRKVIL